MSALSTIMPWFTGGLAGAILTLFVKARYSRSHAKILRLESGIHRLALDSVSLANMLSDSDLKVSYKGQFYENLALYKVILENSGYGAIQNQSVTLLLSPGTAVIDNSIASRPLATDYEKTVVSTEEGVEWSYEFRRIDKENVVTLALLVDSEDDLPVKCFPRGEDGIQYEGNNIQHSSDSADDIQKLVVFAASYILADGLFLASANLSLVNPVKAAILLIASPTIVKVIRSLFDKERNPHRIVVENVHFGDEGSLHIMQNHRPSSS